MNRDTAIDLYLSQVNDGFSLLLKEVERGNRGMVDYISASLFGSLTAGMTLEAIDVETYHLLNYVRRSWAYPDLEASDGQ